MMKKGSILDLGFLMIVLATIITGLIFAKLLTNKLLNNSQMQEIMNKTEVGQEAVNKVYSAYNVFNYGIVFIFVGLYIVSLILAYKMTTENYFLPFALIIIVFFTFLAAVVSNNLTTIIYSSPDLLNVANEMGLSFMILNKLPYLIFFGGMFLIIVLYIGGSGGYE